MHDKLGALKMLRTALGMFQDTTAQVEQPKPGVTCIPAGVAARDAPAVRSEAEEDWGKRWR
jgi:hypothetical protein